MGLNALHARMLWISWCATLIVGCEGVPMETGQLPAGAGNAATGELVVPDELIVAVMPGAHQDDLNALFSDQGVTVRDRLAALSAVLLAVDPSQRDDVASALEDSPLVEGVDDNRLIDTKVVPNDPGYALQWHLLAIDAPGAWETTTGSDQILVAVVDSGVDMDHADLAPKLRLGGNTFDGTASWQDVHGHGTAVAEFDSPRPESPSRARRAGDIA